MASPAGLDELTTSAAGGRMLVVPLGATEQHGPHLPLGTDTMVAVALARALARERDVLVAPALPYGSSGEHSGFPGTLSIGQAALELVVVELARSAGSPVLFVCAHGGNAEPLARAVRQVDGTRAWFPRWAGDAHAGRVETSLVL